MGRSILQECSAVTAVMQVIGYISCVKGKLAQLAIRALDAVFRAGRSDSHSADQPEHLVTGQKGEQAAYFFCAIKVS